jgi:hypothetical protein
MSMMASVYAIKTVPNCSLWELAECEALSHKWLLSEKFGYDVGHRALSDWSRRYWRVFCRYRRLEHLLGRRRIREFDPESFGCLCDPHVSGRPVIRFVLKHFTEDGWENLDFYREATEHGVSFGELFDALCLIDVNSARFDPPFV